MAEPNFEVDGLMYQTSDRPNINTSIPRLPVSDSRKAVGVTGR